MRASKARRLMDREAKRIKRQEAKGLLMKVKSRNLQDHERLLFVVAADYMLNVHPDRSLPLDSTYAMHVDGQRDVRVRRALLRMNRFDAVWLTDLLDDPDAEVRALAAGRPEQLADYLRVAANDEEFIVRQAVWNHPKTPTDVLDMLAPEFADNEREAALW